LNSKVLTSFKLLINWVKLIDDPEVLELFSLLVVSLPSNDQDPVLVPRKMDGYQVGKEWELLVCLELN
jgi:hypothetical protein